MTIGINLPSAGQLTYTQEWPVGKVAMGYKTHRFQLVSGNPIIRLPDGSLFRTLEEAWDHLEAMGRIYLVPFRVEVRPETTGLRLLYEYGHEDDDEDASLEIGALLIGGEFTAVSSASNTKDEPHIFSDKLFRRQTLDGQDTLSVTEANGKSITRHLVFRKDNPMATVAYYHATTE